MLTGFPDCAGGVMTLRRLSSACRQKIPTESAPLRRPFPFSATNPANPKRHEALRIKDVGVVGIPTSGAAVSQAPFARQRASHMS